MPTIMRGSNSSCAPFPGYIQDLEDFGSWVNDANNDTTVIGLLTLSLRIVVNFHHRHIFVTHGAQAHCLAWGCGVRITLQDKSYNSFPRYRIYTVQ